MTPGVGVGSVFVRVHGRGFVALCANPVAGNKKEKERKGSVLGQEGVRNSSAGVVL